MSDDNNPVDKEVNNMVELKEVDSLPVETETDKAGKGRPPHLPNADTRNKVYTLSTVGTRHEDIASVLSISHDTLVKYYK